MNLTCPYCEQDFDGLSSDEVPDERYEIECPHCDKSFAYEIEYEIITTSYKAACLNGGEHEWETHKCYPEFMTQRFCPCGKSEYFYSDPVGRQKMADQYYKEIKRDL